jgi:hypothetical protein
VFQVFATVTLNLSRVTISGGNVTGNPGDRDGSDILNYGRLMLTDSIVSGNTADGGFGSSRGGGIANVGSIAEIANSTISGNRGRRGGGIWNEGASVLITNSTLSNNTGVEDAGCIWNASSSDLTITESSLFDNSTYDQGGGILNSQSVLTISGSTFSDNSTIFTGGGIENTARGTLIVVNSTVSGNSADSAGGIFNGSATVNAKYTIVAGNTGIVSDPDIGGTFSFNSQGNNLIGNKGAAFGFTDGALDTGAVRTDPDEIIAFLDLGLTTMLDVDANGEATALTDGLLIVRYLFGITGTQLTDGLLGTGAVRTEAVEIIAFLDGFLPASASASLVVSTQDVLIANYDEPAVSVGIPGNFKSSPNFTQGTFNDDASTVNDATTTGDVVLPSIDSGPLHNPVLVEEEPADESSVKDVPVIVPEEQA